MPKLRCGSVATLKVVGEAKLRSDVEDLSGLSTERYVELQRRHLPPDAGIQQWMRAPLSGWRLGIS